MSNLNHMSRGTPHLDLICSQSYYPKVKIFKNLKRFFSITILTMLIACGGGGSPEYITTSPDLGSTNPGQNGTSDRPASPPATPSNGESNNSRFVKIDGSGNYLPKNSAEWSCVFDQRTQLIWEEKTNNGDLRDKDWVYTAYESTGSNTGGVCDEQKSCNQTYFRDAVRSMGLCGYKDWRLATVSELESLQDSSKNMAPFIDTEYFPNTASSQYWTTNEFISASNQDIWWVDFSRIYSARTRFKDIKHHVRLVRSKI